MKRILYPYCYLLTTLLLLTLGFVFALVNKPSAAVVVGVLAIYPFVRLYLRAIHPVWIEDERQT